MRTITDASKIVGLTRRMIQEYEKDGIAIKPSKKNKYGYLIYDDASIDRLWQIRFYRELGYDKNTMKSVFDDPGYDYIAALDAQVELLERKKLEIENLISVAKFMKETGLTPRSLHPHIPMMDGISFNDTFGLLGAFSRLQSLGEGEEETGEAPFTDEEFERLWEVFERILKLYEKGSAYNDDTVQTDIRKFHEIARPLLSDTVSGLMFASFLIAPGSVGGEALEKECGLYGVTDFIQKAVYQYCEDNIDKGVDKILNEALEEIVSLGIKKYKPSSDEVQAVVSKIYSYYATAFDPDFISPREMVGGIIELFSDPGYYAFFDKISHAKGAGQYVAAAMRHYCKKLDTA